MIDVYIDPVPADYFIHWLFKHRCIECKKPATEINEIVPRSRSKKSILTWQNRVTLCRECHMKFHQNGVTDMKIQAMRDVRKNYLISIGREEYI